MLAMLASIGIEKGKPFQPDATRARLLTAAVREAEATMNDGFMNHSFEPFWPGRQWQAHQAREQLRLLLLRQRHARLRPPRRGLRLLGDVGAEAAGRSEEAAASYYLKNFRDSTGALFRGTNRYRLRVPADTPAHDFWSIIAYEVGTNAFIHNPENRVGVSSYDKQQMTVNPDGSVDVYIGPTAPDGLTNNWIPTAGKDFWLIARFYGPDKVLFEKTWVMPDVEKVS